MSTAEQDRTVTLTIAPEDSHPIRRYYVSEVCTLVDELASCRPCGSPLNSEVGGFDDLPDYLRRLDDLRAKLDHYGWVPAEGPITVTLPVADVECAIAESIATATFGRGPGAEGYVEAASHGGEDLAELHAAVWLRDQLSAMGEGVA